MIQSLSLAQFAIGATTLAYFNQHKLCAKADSLFRQGDFNVACPMYDKAFAASTNNNLYAIRKIRCKSITEPASPQMIELLHAHGIKNSWIASDSILGPYLADLLPDSTSQKVVPERYMVTLDSLYVVDQQIRGSNVPLEKALQVDSMNYNLLISIFRETGRYINSRGSILVLLHQLGYHPNDMPFVVGLLNGALLENNLDPETYAGILDRAFYTQNRCVLFGLYSTINDPSPSTCAGEDVLKLYRHRLGIE